MSSLELRPFLDVLQDVELFTSILNGLGIDIQVNSELDKSLRLLRALQEQSICDSAESQKVKLPRELQSAIGMLHLAQLVIERSTHPDFKNLKPHLELLNISVPSQASRHSPRDQFSMKLFELSIALAAMKTGKDLRLEDPVRQSKGDNPDVLCRMRDGRLWGFACKTVQGKSPKSLFNLLVGGISQIQKSIADVGIVTVSFRNLLPHDEHLPELGCNEHGKAITRCYQTTEPVLSNLKEFVSNRLVEMLQSIGKDNIWPYFQQKKALPGILVPIQTVLVLRSGKGPVPTFHGFLYLFSLSDTCPIVIPTNSDPWFDMQTMMVLKDVLHGFKAATQ